MENAAGPPNSLSGLHLRSAVDQDAPAMHQLTHSAYRRYVERIGRQPAPMTADYSQLRPPSCAWLLEEHGQLVGVLVGEWARDHLLVENVAVHASYRGQGAGTMLLNWAEQQARAAGKDEVRLYTNAAMHENVAYYPRRGYREIRRTVEDGYQRVHFAKFVRP